MQRTKIAYLTHTWNPIAMRCDKVSIGCDNCWHLKMAKRLAGNTSIPLSRRVSYQGHMPYLLDDKIEEFANDSGKSGCGAFREAWALSGLACEEAGLVDQTVPEPAADNVTSAVTVFAAL